jgi:hypothetical protein
MEEGRGDAVAQGIMWTPLEATRTSLRHSLR